MDEIKNTFLLHIGHQQSCHNQKGIITKLFEGLNANLILIDYILKFEAIRFREKATEFFGKKDISWHRTVVFLTLESSLSQNDRDSNTNNGAVERSMHTLLFDHILSNDMTHNFAAVCYLLDAVLARLPEVLPSVRSFYVLSDNAKCYQNYLLPVFAPSLHVITL